MRRSVRAGERYARAGFSDKERERERKKGGWDGWDQIDFRVQIDSNTGEKVETPARRPEERQKRSALVSRR